MKHYAYAYTECRRKTKGYYRIEKTVVLYRYTRDGIRQVARVTDTFVDQWQLVMLALSTLRGKDAPPKRLFERSPMGGFDVRCRASAIALGLAHITQL